MVQLINYKLKNQMKKLNGLYRAKSGLGHFDRNYKEDDKVKFVKYLGESRHGDNRIKYALLNWKGEELYKGNHFKTSHINWNVRYIIKTN